MLDTLENMLNTLFSEYGALVTLELVLIYILWKRTVELSDVLVSITKNNTEVLTKLVQRLEEHD